MTKKAKKVPFDSKVFLATVNDGRSISEYRMNQKVFSQGSSADAVFYIQKGKVKITVVSEQGKGRRGAGAGRILRRGMPDRAAGALSDRNGNYGMRDHAPGQGSHGPCPP
jgi:CRP-like cAMP-binding protein